MSIHLDCARFGIIFLLIVGLALAPVVTLQAAQMETSEAVAADVSQVAETGFVIDHTKIELFDDIPDSYIQAASELSLLFRHASVGGNINDGLNCLMNNFSQRPNYCDRGLPPDQVIYNAKYNRNAWLFEFHSPPPNPNPGWPNKVNYFINRVNGLPQGQYDVVGFKFGYVDGTAGSDIDNQFFNTVPSNTQPNVDDLEALEAAHPDKTLMWWTMGLARSVGTADASSFNQQMRAYTTAHNKVLMDIADIQSHRPDGSACYGNQGNNIEALCAEYTDETNGGHLNALGKQRMAKAVWLLMATLAGWDGISGSTDIIFADGFESGNLSAWSNYYTDGNDLTVTTSAALVGSRGLQAIIDDNVAISVLDERPAGESRYRARFYLDINGITMGQNNRHFIFYGYSGSGLTRPVVRVELVYQNNIYRLYPAIFDDGTTWRNSSHIPISDAPHLVEIDWSASTAPGANNGALSLWVDGTQRINLTGIDNDTRRIERVRLGALDGIDNGTRGSYYLDAFESRRQSYIGPAAGAQITAVEESAIDPAEMYFYTEEEESTPLDPGPFELPWNEDEDQGPVLDSPLYLPLLSH